jgi:hypothetical protein
MRQGSTPVRAEIDKHGNRDTVEISSNKISSTAKGSESGGNGDLQRPQRPVLAKYFAGIRLFWPQWLQARITGK